MFVTNNLLVSSENLGEHLTWLEHEFSTWYWVFHVQKQDSKYLCSGMDFIRVHTERMPVRFSELQSSSIP